MIKSILNKLKGVALVALASVVPVASASAQTVYDFASSSEESNALAGALTSQAFLIVFGGIAVLLTAALAFMGAGWVWGRFKKFTGIKKKI